MQKKIIALAIAGLASTAAFAQSNVTVYGVADAYVANVGSAASGVTAVNGGGLAGSRLGFKGVEDLGGGTKALFTLEYGLSNDANAGVGAGTALARQQFVGLTGGMGTLIAGRLQSLAYNHNVSFNPTAGTVADTQVSAIAGLNGGNGNSGAANRLAVGTTERLDNAVAYVAPAFGGLTLAAAYTANAAGAEAAGAGGSISTVDQIRAAEFSGSYAAGAFAAGLTYRSLLAQAGTPNGENSTVVGASYDFGVAKIFLNLATAKTIVDTANSARVMTSGGLTAPVGANGALILSAATARNEAGAVNTTMAALYKHSLSKRTALYAGVAQAKGHDDGVAAGNNSTVATLAGVNSGNGGTVGVALAGINHSF